MSRYTQFIDNVVGVPVTMQRSAVQVVQKTVPQMQFIDKMVDIPVVQQWQVPVVRQWQVLTVQNSPEYCGGATSSVPG